MKISIIIPVLNEAVRIESLLLWMQQTGSQDEIIVVDGGSTDNTVKKAKEKGAKVIQAEKGRAKQMNAGARRATGSLLYFVHADVRPPKSWRRDIIEASKTYPAGCFSYCFDCSDRLLSINARATRINTWLSGGGDQTLFIHKNVFEKIGQFDESLSIMEDFDFVWRLKKEHAFTVICNDAKVSARKYAHNGYLKVQLVNLITLVCFRLGVPADRLDHFYGHCLKR